ncbi:MAG: hypothetical protein H6733_14115 [Alphaproteobacteria bacterium]|nr:hypothetical protein [Alphaproteobacteria bacterium]
MRPYALALLALAACQAAAPDAADTGVIVSDPMTIGAIAVGPTLSAPEQAFTRNFLTFDIDGAPNGTFRIGVSLSEPGSGPVACPPGLGCSDLVSPAYAVGSGTLDGTGHGTFSVRVPRNLSDTTAHFQAAVFSGGSLQLTNSVDVEIYNICNGAPVIDDALRLGVAAQGDYAISFATPVAPYMADVDLYDTFFSSVDVTTYASADGYTLYVDPVEDVAPFTFHTMIVSDACNQSTVASFTTGGAHTVEGDKLLGKVWTIDTESIVVHSPMGFDAFLPLLADYDELYMGMATAFDALTGDLTGIGGMTTDLGAGLEQDTCRSTEEITVDFSGDPEISYAATELGAGQDLDVTVDFQDGGKIIHGRGSAMIYALDTSRYAGLGDNEALICSLVESAGNPPCEPCPYDAAHLCYFADVEAYAFQSDLDMVEVTPAEVAGTCPTETPWF